MSLKLGRKAPRWTPRLARARAVLHAHLSQLGPSPDSSFPFMDAVTKAVGDDIGMMGNDVLGDCTCADEGHSIMVRTANSGTIVQPSTADVENMYKNFGWDGKLPPDSTDGGADETSVCEWAESTGLLGHKSANFGDIDFTNWEYVRWAIQIFGPVRIGFLVPSYIMDQFNSGQPWSTVGQDPNAPIEGGHDVPLVGYAGATGKAIYYVATWGRFHPCDESFFKLVEEAHPAVYPDFIKQGGLSPDGFNLDQMLADLEAVRSEPPQSPPPPPGPTNTQTGTTTGNAGSKRTPGSVINNGKIDT